MQSEPALERRLGRIQKKGDTLIAAMGAAKDSTKKLITNWHGKNGIFTQLLKQHRKV